LRRLESSKKLKAVMVATPPTPGRVWLGGEKVTARSNYKYIEKHNSAEPTLRSGHTTRFRQLARRLPRPRHGATLRLVSTRGVVVSRCVRSRGGSMGGRRSHTDHSHTQAPPWRIGSEIVRCHSKDITVHSSSSSSLLMNKRSLPPPWPPYRSFFICSSCCCLAASTF